MAKIVFYEIAPVDVPHLDNYFRDARHDYQYIAETVTADTAVSDAEAISVFVNSVVTREVLDRLPNLKLIATRSTGFDHIDLDYATERGVKVVNVPTYGENTVAEHAFALLLSISKKLLPTVEATQRGDFKSHDYVGLDLKDKTLGIIGLGHIGAYTARIGRGFGMKVLAYDLNPRHELADEIGLTYTSLSEVLQNSNVISLHAPSTPSNYHMINQHTIEQMQPGTILINTSRGELVENRALITGLESGRLAGVGLDTFEGERQLMMPAMIKAIENNSAAPELYEHIAETRILLNHPQVILTPHVAFNTSEAVERINSTTAKNILGFFDDNPQNLISATSSSGKLVIIRHGESEWNRLGKWTGSTDVHLTPEAIEKTAELGKKLADIEFDYAYISEYVRTLETLEAIKNGSGQLGMPFEAARPLNERDYGVYTGMDKQGILAAIGEQAYDELRRSWDSPVEGGESLRDVYNRAVPFYLRIILPRLRHGQDVLVVAHGNSIRSLIKYIENISDDEIGDIEMGHDKALIYQVDSEGRQKKIDSTSLN